MQAQTLTVYIVSRGDRVSNLDMTSCRVHEQRNNIADRIRAIPGKLEDSVKATKAPENTAAITINRNHKSAAQ